MNFGIKNARSLDKSRLLGTASKLTVTLGGSGWIRTTEVVDNRFTVCPLWPLGNTPIFPYSVVNKKMELVDGLEPPTC